ncbi:hypothetical protein K491DRAFT_696035 [Lophiostoma macrostomum CBS 122681]|uniref:Uncharacterized protein n=1 Tax=Lophiostoma macrostomum CBS 122681 TaxID=1314788 RepID=A0A6A6SWF2_9PLEO|nr:hypothetical protein K491DRAFT_696035 [Lophiostoma macrostomum CBS 122681]
MSSSSSSPLLSSSAQVDASIYTHPNSTQTPHTFLPIEFQFIAALLTDSGSTSYVNHRLLNLMVAVTTNKKFIATLASPPYNYDYQAWLEEIGAAPDEFLSQLSAAMKSKRVEFLATCALVCVALLWVGRLAQRAGHAKLYVTALIGGVIAPFWFAEVRLLEWDVRIWVGMFIIQSAGVGVVLGAAGWLFDCVFGAQGDSSRAVQTAVDHREEKSQGISDGNGTDNADDRDKSIASEGKAESD